MNPQNDYEPRIVGFESKPIPTSNTNELKKFGLIGVAILFVLFLIFSPTPSVDSPAKNQKTRYVAPKSNSPSYRSAEEAIEAVNAYVDQQMNENKQLFRSLKNH